MKGLDLYMEKMNRDSSLASRFVEAVSKLKSLDRLKLGFMSMPPSNTSFVNIYRSSVKFLWIYLYLSILALKPVFISNIIRNAPKLDWLFSSVWVPAEKQKPTIDSGHFREWVEIVSKRCNKTPLEIWLCPESYASKYTNPVKAREGTFTLLMSDE